MQSLATVRDEGDADMTLIMEKAYIKPSHQKTAALVQDALLSSLSEVHLPSAIQSLTLQDNSADTVQALARILYRICNSDRIPEDRAKTSLQNLFAQLGPRCLVFLLIIALDKSESLELRVVSIRHVQAFITAHAAGGGKLQTDFQCAIPALLILLTDKKKKIREVTCFTLRLLRIGSGGVAQSVYGIDDLYGEATRNVQILQPKDLTQYLDAIVASAADISADSSVLQTLHTRLLNAQHNESKKVTAYVNPHLVRSPAELDIPPSHRRAVIAVLLSHVLGWRSLAPRMALLNVLAHVQDSAKETALLPLLKELSSKDTEEARWARSLSVVDQRHLAAYILDCLTARVAKAISRGQAAETFNLILDLITKDDETETGKRARSCWIILVLKSSFSDALESVLRQTTMSKIAQTMWPILSLDQQIQLMLTLLKGLAFYNEVSLICELPYSC